MHDGTQILVCGTLDIHRQSLSRDVLAGLDGGMVLSPTGARATRVVGQAGYEVIDVP
jgi:hypothetical protein